MMGPLTREIGDLAVASAARERSREAARQVWHDDVFRTLDARALQRLETESRIFASTLADVDALLAQALSLIA